MKTFLFIFLAGYAVRCDDTNYYVVQMPDDVPTKDFKVYWNVPTMQCKSKKILFEDLYEKYGILQNAGDTFRGDKISILYDPGDFPALLRNSSGEIKYRNGGVPQEGDLIKHLDTFQNVLEQSVPDENFSGVGIIDFESWKPVLRQNFGILTPYKDVSYEIEKKRHWWWKKQWIEEEAKRRFEGAGREFMQATVTLAKKMRPHALWGYYGYPYCFNMAFNNRKESCADKVPQENNRINWLWEESTALYPSVYSTDDMTSGQLAGLIRGRVKEAARVAVRGSPILPYFWFRYRDKGYFTEKDLDVAVNTFYKSNASGFIIWGSSNDVNTVEKCTGLRKYVTDILGPAIAKYTKPQTKLEDEPEETISTIFKPNNASKYDPEYTWIPPVNYTQNIEQMVEKELKEEKETAVVNKEIKESILVDMILHKIADSDYCAEDCDSKNKVWKTEINGGDGNSESRLVLVTEDPFKKSSSQIPVTVPTTTEEDLYDYDLSTGGIKVGDFFEINEYSDISTTSKTTEEASTKIISAEKISTVGINNAESSTNNLKTTDDSEIDLSADQSNAIDVTPEDISTTDVSSTIDLSSIESTTNDLSTDESTTNEFSTTESTTNHRTEETGIIDNELNIIEISTIIINEMEPEVSLSSEEEEDTEDFSTEDSSTTYPTTEESTTVAANGTNSDSSTALAPVLTEQVVVSVV